MSSPYESMARDVVNRLCRARPREWQAIVLHALDSVAHASEEVHGEACDLLRTELLDRRDAELACLHDGCGHSLGDHVGGGECGVGLDCTEAGGWVRCECSKFVLAGAEVVTQ